MIYSKPNYSFFFAVFITKFLNLKASFSFTQMTFPCFKAYFIKRTRTRTQTFKKADPIPKITVWVKDLFLTNLRVLILNMTILFWNPNPKHKAFLVQIWDNFASSQNFAIDKIEGADSKYDNTLLNF